MKCLIFFLSFLLLGLSAQVGMAAGFLLYYAPGTTYSILAGYSSISHPTSHICYITDKKGKRTQIKTADIIANIPYPPASGQDAEALIAELDMLETQHPQHAKIIAATRQAWQKHKTVAEAIQTPPPSRPTPPHITSSETSSSKSPKPASSPVSISASNALDSDTADSIWDSLLEKLKTGNLGEAFMIAQQGAKSFPRDHLIAEITQQLISVVQGVQTYQSAQKEITASQPEIQRLRRNADVSDRPSILIPGDNSAQLRAQTARDKAEQIEEQGQKNLENAKGEIAKALEAIGKLEYSFREAGVYDGAVAMAQFSHLLSTKYGLPNEDSFYSSALQTNLITSDAAHTKALAALERRALREAGKHLSKAIESFPRSRKSLALKVKIDALFKECGTYFEEAEDAKKAKNYEAALTCLEKLFQIAIDFGEAMELKSELQGILADKERQLSTAKIKEQSQDYEAALAIYDLYASEDNIRRVSAALGDRDAKEANFVAAISHYERAGMGEKAGLLREKAKEQKEAYKKAELLLLDGKMDEAIAIYESYNDAQAIHVALVALGNTQEEDGKFEAALALYRRAEAVDDIQRVQHQIEERYKLASEAKKKENTGDYETAIELYEDCGAFEEMKRVAALFAKQLEAKGDLATALGCYEIAELPNEAKRIRETSDVKEASAPGRHKCDAKEIYEKNINAVVTVIAEGFRGTGNGTGFFVRRGGWIVTNHHVIDEARKITVRTNNGSLYPARLAMATETPDFALLKIELPFHSIVRLGRSKDIKAGENVFAIGSPGGADNEILEGTITSGIVSNPNREFLNNRVMQIDAAINHGNSGGPLFSERNEVVGINTFGLGTSEVVNIQGIGSDKQNLNFALHIDEVAPLLEKHAR